MSAKKVTKKSSNKLPNQAAPTKKPTTVKRSASSQKIVVSLAVGALLLGIIGVGVHRWYSESRRIVNILVADQVEELAGIFRAIHEKCYIIDFEHEKNYVDFLTVINFAGSEVGAMNLAYPNRWEGPYVKDNPTMQQQQYVVISTEQGYFVAPGDGVRLSDGRIIGHDIVLNKETKFDELLADGTLMYKGRALVQKIDI